LFLILVLWQMPHFYAIAMYRFDDYEAAGLPVLTVKHGMKNAKLQIRLYIVAFIAASALLTVFGYIGFVYLVVMLGLGAAWLWLAVGGPRSVDNARWARQIFRFSLIVILGLSLMLSTSSLLP